MDMLNKEKLLNIISKYPLLNQCFSKYIIWFCDSVKEDDYDEYDLITVLKNTNEHFRLPSLEKGLNQSRNILKMNEKKFCNTFGFTKDLLTNEREKIHDVLAEPQFVLTLNKKIHFRDIEKLPRSIQINKNKIPNSDFIATLNKKKWAIEIKTIRFGKVNTSQNNHSREASWFYNMFLNNAINKIKEHKGRLFTQLDNACKHYNCEKRMLGLYYRRLAPSTFMPRNRYYDAIGILRKKYPILDYICVKTYFGDIYIK